MMTESLIAVTQSAVSTTLLAADVVPVVAFVLLTIYGGTAMISPGIFSPPEVATDGGTSHYNAFGHFAVGLTAIAIYVPLAFIV